MPEASGESIDGAGCESGIGVGVSLVFGPLPPGQPGAHRLRVLLAITAGGRPLRPQRFAFPPVPTAMHDDPGAYPTGLGPFTDGSVLLYTGPLHHALPPSGFGSRP